MSNPKTVDELKAELAGLNGVQAPNPPEIMLITKLIEVEGKLGDAEGKLESTRGQLKDADECNMGLLESVVQKERNAKDFAAELDETKAELLKTKYALETANQALKVALEEKLDNVRTAELEETKAELLKTKAELEKANRMSKQTQEAATLNKNLAASTARVEELTSEVEQAKEEKRILKKTMTYLWTALGEYKAELQAVLEARLKDEEALAEIEAKLAKLAKLAEIKPAS